MHRSVRQSATSLINEFENLYKSTLVKLDTIVSILMEAFFAAAVKDSLISKNSSLVSEHSSATRVTLY